MERESPKSASLTVQSSLMRMLAGLRSLWMMFAEWIYCRPHSKLYTTVEMCFYSR